MSLKEGCEWEGHCVGDFCTNENECDGDLGCLNFVCGDANCEWLGHCAGTLCQRHSDCSDDLSCNNGVCSYPEGFVAADDAISTTLPSPSETSTPSPTAVSSESRGDAGSGRLSAGSGAGIGIGVTLALTLAALAIFFYIRRWRRKPNPQELEDKSYSPSYRSDMEDKGPGIIRIINPGVSTEVDSSPPTPREMDSKAKMIFPAELNANRSPAIAEIDSEPPRKYESGAPMPDSPTIASPANFSAFVPGQDPSRPYGAPAPYPPPFTSSYTSPYAPPDSNISPIEGRNETLTGIDMYDGTGSHRNGAASGRYGGQWHGV